MPFATLAALACMSAPSHMEDSALLLGLRDQQGQYRTLLIGKRGVALVQLERKGEVVIGNKEGITGLSVKEKTLVGPMRKLTTSIALRISWVTIDFIGVERDVTTDGKPPFTKIERQVLTFPELDEVPVKQELVDPTSVHLVTAVDDALSKNPRALVPKNLDERDWGYLRQNGHWMFVGALKTPTERVEVLVPGPLVTKTPPTDTGTVSWPSVTRTYPDATDLVSHKAAGIAVVVTPEAIYVHEASAISLGRELRKLPARNEVVVSTIWGGFDELDTWRRELPNR
jgi:hypothetical protein